MTRLRRTLSQLIMCCLVLTGCAPALRVPANDPAFTSHPMTRVPAPVPTYHPDMTLEKAKAISLAMQDDLVAFVPPEWIAERDTHQTSHLGSCRGKDYSLWRGWTKLTLTAPHDAKDIVEKIAQHYETGTTYRVNRSIAVDGAALVDLAATDGSGYLFGNEASDHTDIVIMADSPCFRLPDGLSPRRDY